MTVAELIEVLGECQPDAVVYMASDPEGNSFWTMDAISDDSTNIMLWPGAAVEPEEDGE